MIVVILLMALTIRYLLPKTLSFTLLGDISQLRDENADHCVGAFILVEGNMKRSLF